MNAETIGYTLPRAQWEALRMTLELSDPFHALEMTMSSDELRIACAELCSIGLLTPSGERVIVEALAAYLLTELSKADLALEGWSGDHRAMLLRALHMTIMVETHRGQTTLTPIENAASARPLFEAFIARCPVPVSFALRNRNAVCMAGDSSDTVQIQEILDRLYRAFAAGTVD